MLFLLLLLVHFHLWQLAHLHLPDLHAALDLTLGLLAGLALDRDSGAGRLRKQL